MPFFRALCHAGRLDKTYNVRALALSELKKWLLRVHIIVQAEVRPGQRAAVAARQTLDPGLRVASHDEVMKHMTDRKLYPAMVGVIGENFTV